MVSRRGGSSPSRLPDEPEREGAGTGTSLVGTATRASSTVAGGVVGASSSSVEALIGDSSCLCCAMFPGQLHLGPPALGAEHTKEKHSRFARLFRPLNKSTTMTNRALVTVAIFSRMVLDAIAVLLRELVVSLLSLFVSRGLLSGGFAAPPGSRTSSPPPATFCPRGCDFVTNSGYEVVDGSPNTDAPSHEDLMDNDVDFIRSWSDVIKYG